MTYPKGLENFKSESETGATLEIFDVPPLSQIVLTKINGEIYMQEFYYSANHWEMGQTRLHSLETGLHLVCHAIRYWQNEVKNAELVM